MGGSGNQTQTQQLPKWAEPYAQQGVRGLYGTMLPGGSPSPYPLPDQQVAGLTPDQYLAFQQAAGMRGDVQSAFAPFGPGQMNPYLSPYSNAAAQDLIAQYQTATEPGILARSAATGNIGSASTAESLANSQQALSAGLADLNARIYEPAYESSQGRALSAAGSEVSGLMGAQNILGQAGAQQQQQQQNVLDTQYKNAYSAAMWPYQTFDRLAQDFGGLMGNQLTTKISGGSK